MGDVVALQLFQTVENRVLSSVIDLSSLPAESPRTNSQADTTREILLALGRDLVREGRQLPVPVNLVVLDLLYLAVPRNPRHNKGHQRLIRAIVVGRGNVLFH